MPNTDPPLTDRTTIIRRIELADAGRRELSRRHGLEADLFHGLYGGITPDPAQLHEMVAAHRELFPRMVGLKLYAGHSTGRMGVVDRETQRLVWLTLAEAGYNGVVAVHAEEEALLRPDIWDPDEPSSHSPSRPPEAEIASVRQQIELARDARFRGSLHICHVSTPEALDLIGETRRNGGLPFSLRCGVTPHHLLLEASVANRSSVAEWNVNPPLRDEARRIRLWALVEKGAADWIESDHAPHRWSDKEKGASGLPGLPAFRALADRLDRPLFGTRVAKAFEMEPALFPANPNLTGSVITSSGELHGAKEYPWDPYRFCEFRVR